MSAHLLAEEYEGARFEAIKARFILLAVLSVLLQGAAPPENTTEEEERETERETVAHMVDLEMEEARPTLLPVMDGDPRVTPLAVLYGGKRGV